MGATDRDVHRPWLAYALEESLEHSLLTPKHVIDHANPEVLVTQLPPSVISLLLARALTIGTFSAAQVLESVPPAVLAEHLDPEVMWRCLKDAAERGGLSRAGGARTPQSRQWFASVLGRALESELVTPADVLRFLPPSEFAAAAPRSVMAELIKEALARSKFDADLVLEHITPSVIAETLETSLVWDCITEAVGQHFEIVTAPITKTNGTTAARAATTPGPSGAATPSPASLGAAAGKLPVKPAENNRPAVPRPASPSDDKTPPPAVLGGAATPSSKAPGAGPGVASGDGASSRIPATVPTSVTPAPTARHASDEWTATSEDRRPLSPTPR